MSSTVFRKKYSILCTLVKRLADLCFDSSAGAVGTRVAGAEGTRVASPGLLEQLGPGLLAQLGPGLPDHFTFSRTF